MNGPTRKQNEPSSGPRALSELRGEILRVTDQAFLAILDYHTTFGDVGKSTPNGEPVGVLRNFIVSGRELLILASVIRQGVEQGMTSASVDLLAQEGIAALRERREDFTREELTRVQSVLQSAPKEQWTANCAELLRTVLQLVQQRGGG